MKHCITKPIGLATPCKEIENACGQAHLYKHCGLRPMHYIIPLDSGSGRTTLVEYMVDKYKEAGVMNFSGALDDYLEITFDGTPQQLKRAFDMIDAAAVYSNDFCNIVSMDISAISAHLAETQLAEFLKNCKRVCEHACVIFFVHSIPSKNEEQLLAKLHKAVGGIKRLEVEPYTKDDMCALIIKTIAQHGVEINHKARFCAELSDMVSRFNINGVKDALSVADSLVRLADFSSFVPTIDESSLNLMITGRRNEAERGEIK